MAEVAKLTAKLMADTRDFDRGMTSARKNLDKLDGSVGDTSKSVGGLTGNVKQFAVAAGAAFGASRILSFAKGAVNEFSKLEESTNAVNVVFGESADIIHEFGKTSATSAGLAQSSFNQLATTTGALLTNFGFSARDAADETVNLAQRAADMASVFDTEVDDALTAINSALRGETEPIRRFAVDVSNASIAQEALAQGIEKSVDEMSQQEKVALRLDVIMKQTEKTAGDFAATSDSLANKQRVLTERWKDAQAILGEKLADSMTELLDTGLELVPVFVSLADEVSATAQAIAALIKGTKDAAGLLDDMGVASGDLKSESGLLSKVLDGIPGGQFARRMAELFGVYQDVSEAAEVAAGRVADTNTHLDNARHSGGAAGEGITIAADAAGQGAPKVQDLADALNNAAGASTSLIESIKSGSWIQDASLRIQTDRLLGTGAAGRDEDRGGANLTRRNTGASIARRASGGMVPGPLGAPRLIMAHGGEELLTSADRYSRDVTVNMNGNVTSGGNLTDELTTGLLMAGVNEHAEFRGISDIR